MSIYKDLANIIEEGNLTVTRNCIPDGFTVTYYFVCDGDVIVCCINDDTLGQFTKENCTKAYNEIKDYLLRRNMETPEAFVEWLETKRKS